MAIAVVYRPPGMTAEQYKEIWSGSDGHRVRTARGLLFHAGVGEADEFFTISVWESQESYDEFAPVFKQVMSGQGIRLRHSRHACRASPDRPVELTQNCRFFVPAGRRRRNQTASCVVRWRR